MKYLFRIVLFIIARGGLSLAVVAWGISEWVRIMTSATVETCSAKIDICSRGVAAASFGESGTYLVLPPVDVAEAIQVFEPRDQDLERFDYTHPVPGVNDLTDGSVILISIRHWFVIAAFALFYATLKLIFRQRRQPCEF